MPDPTTPDACLRCIVCRVLLAPILARLGALHCHDHKPMPDRPPERRPW